MFLQLFLEEREDFLAPLFTKGKIKRGRAPAAAGKRRRKKKEKKKKKEDRLTRLAASGVPFANASMFRPVLPPAFLFEAGVASRSFFHLDSPQERKM